MTADPTNDEAKELRAVITAICNHDWIIATAFRDSTRDFGWQVNVRDGGPRKDGTQRYKPVRETFALDPVGAGLNGIRMGVPRDR